MKVKPLILFFIVCILINLLTACTRIADNNEHLGEVITENHTRIMPKNVIQIGETYEFSTTQADGHFLCTITGVRMVTTQSECPPDEWFDAEYAATLEASDDDHYPYEEWFAKDGAFERNCRIILVDISVTNVDAQSWLDNGTFVTGCGWFADANLFYAYDFGKLADLDTVIKQNNTQQYMTIGSFGFSKFGEYADDPNTKGYEPAAIRIAPGETVSYTLAYPINATLFGTEDGTLRDLSSLMLCISLDTDPENGIFVDLKLGDS